MKSRIALMSAWVCVLSYGSLAQAYNTGDYQNILHQLSRVCGYDPKICIDSKRLILDVLALFGRSHFFKIPRQQSFNFFNRIGIRQCFEYLS